MPGLGGFLTPEDIAYQVAHIHEDKRPSTVAGLAILSAVSTIAVFSKFAIRWRTRSGFKTDDYTIALALVFGWGLFVSSLYDTRYGIGLHVIAVKPDHFKNLLQVLFLSSPTFFIGVALTQVSILFLYKRLFTLFLRWFRITFYVLLFSSVGAAIAFSLASYLRCFPINSNWDPTIRGAHCGVDIHAVYVTSCVINLVTDLGIVAAPMPLIWKLQMSRGTKTAVTGMFLLAGFICIINLIKLYYAVVAVQKDFTFDTRIILWTHAELTLGIVNACLPCYRPFFKGLRGVFSTVFSTQKSRSTTNPGSKKSADAFGASNAGERSGLTGPKIELASVDQWSVASRQGKNPTVTYKVSAESGPETHDFRGGLSSHSPV